MKSIFLALSFGLYTYGVFELGRRDEASNRKFILAEIAAVSRIKAELEWCKSTLDALSEKPLHDPEIQVERISI